MATDVSKRPQIMSDWKTLVITGLFLFLVGFVGLTGVLPLGLGLPVEWTAFTLLSLFGLGLTMYGLGQAV